MSGTKRFLKASIGNIIEWYDFSLFAYYSLAISTALFPNGSEMKSIIELFFIFGIGFLARPIGGFILGKIGDKYGHYFAVNFSVYGMSACSFLIAFIPDYSILGGYSLFLLIMLRLGQGFCAGAQFSGLMSIVTNITLKKRSFFANIAYTVSTTGLLLAIIIAIILTQVIPTEYKSYIWRIAFILSGVFGLVFHFFCIEKDYKISNQNNKEEVIHFKLKELFLTQYRAIAGIIILSWYSGCMYFFSYTFLYTYLTFVLKLSPNTAYIISIIQMILGCVLYPVAGVIADYFGKQKTSILGTIATAFIVFLFIQTHSILFIIVLSSLLVICHTLIISGISSVSAEVFFQNGE